MRRFSKDKEIMVIVERMNRVDLIEKSHISWMIILGQQLLEKKK